MTTRVITEILGGTLDKAARGRVELQDDGRGVSCVLVMFSRFPSRLSALFGSAWSRVTGSRFPPVSPPYVRTAFNHRKNSRRVHRNRPLRVCHTGAESRAGGGTTS